MYFQSILQIDIKFPIIADPDRKISMAYNMIDPANLDDDGLPLTIRAVFIIDPEKKVLSIRKFENHFELHTNLFL